MLDSLNSMAKAVDFEKKTSGKRNQRKRAKVFDTSISNKKKKNEEHSTSISDENNSKSVNNQFNIIRKHLGSKKDLNKTIDDLCADLGFSKYVSEDDLSDDSETEQLPPKNDSIENCIYKIFEGLDDYAAFNPYLISGSTPKVMRGGFSATDPSIRPTPGISSVNRPKSILKSRNENNLLDESSKTPRTSLGSVILNDSEKSNSDRTPLSDKTNLLLTPAPFVRSLDLNRSPSPTPPTPNPLLQASFRTPKTVSKSCKKPLSPGIIEVSPETKRTILVGIACFVDVKTNKEDCSSSVALELLSMGANVEKTFNKKVTHVIFKEGKPSTYFKAKKLGITMVSVLWIEACKKERKMVDPSLHPPVCMEKYHSLSPSGKKLPSMKTIQKKLRRHLLWEAGMHSVDNKSKTRMGWRKAVTEIKLPRTNNSQEGSQGRLHCNKKLDFQSAEPVNHDVISDCKENQTPHDSIIIISDSTESQIESKISDENKDSSVSLSDIHLSSQLERRKSAPAIFIPERKKRKRKDELELAGVTQNKFMTIDKLFAKQMVLNENKQKCKEHNENGTQCSQNRRKKLLNLNEEIVVLDSPEGKDTPPPITFESAYKLEEEKSIEKRAQTKSTSVRKIFKKVASKKPVAKKSLTSLLEQDELNSSSRNSLTYFKETKKTEPKIVRDPPTIVCTSLLPEDVRKVAYVVGKLGTFDIEDKVSAKTTHLITSAPRRTINLLKALVRGAWILHYDWIVKSEESGYWLNEEEFELKTFSHAVTELRRERQAFGSSFSSELFSTCGSIYISKRSIPSHKDLSELIKLCKGKVVASSSSADFVVGGKILEGEKIQRIKEKWVLDSITQNTLLDPDRYIIKPDKS